jgi:hypothetical protein
LSNQPFQPLVVGAPRSGFALLASVVIHFLPRAERHADQRQEVLNVLLRGVGDHVSEQVVACFERHGITNDLLFNPNFRYLVGGPKWIPRDRPDTACFRKYIGVRGKGDFTLVTSHPREVLNLDEIVHSHTDPALWLEHPGYADYTKFASVRSPVDILNSSVFSLNALSSEYIQKFIPPELDNDNIRQDLALYKFTDLDFFEGLVKFLAGYFEEFLAVHDRYILMRWEDLIQQPVPTIQRLAREAGVPMDADYAADIWRKLDHVNLTQAHKHNYRAGHGVVGGWKNWITNHHLRLIKDHGFEKHMVALGYGEIELLDESRYTPFQQKVSACIDAGKVHREFFDPDLFTFAFNKSNLISDKFPFKRYEWRQHTQIERSIFTDEALQNEIWDCAEQACGELNALIGDYLASSTGLEGKALDKLLERLQKEHRPTLGRAMGERYTAAFQNARARVKHGEALHGAIMKARSLAGKVKRRAGRLVSRVAPPRATNTPVEPPRLVVTEAACNVVEYRGRFYALPHALGPVELDKQDVEGMSGVLVTESQARAQDYARQFGGENAVAQAPEVEEKEERRLVFFDPTVDGAARVLDGLGRRRIVLHAWDGFAAGLVERIGSGKKFAVLTSPEGHPAPAGVEILAAPAPGDALLLNEFDAEKLSALLLEHLDAENMTLVAPVTSHYCRHRPLFLISIPKGGTHLLAWCTTATLCRVAGIAWNIPTPIPWRGISLLTPCGGNLSATGIIRSHAHRRCSSTAIRWILSCRRPTTTTATAPRFFRPTCAIWISSTGCSV